MGWEQDPELGFGNAKPAEKPAPEPRVRRTPVLASPVVLTAQSMGKLAGASVRSKPAFVNLPCFTC